MLFGAVSDVDRRMLEPVPRAVPIAIVIKVKPTTGTFRARGMVTVRQMRLAYEVRAVAGVLKGLAQECGVIWVESAAIVAGPMGRGVLASDHRGSTGETHGRWCICVWNVNAAACQPI